MRKPKFKNEFKNGTRVESFHCPETEGITGVVEETFHDYCVNPYVYFHNQWVKVRRDDNGKTLHTLACFLREIK